MASDNEVAVFTDTNIGTHLAMAVSPDTTVGDFQSELERTHQSCFPELGKIEVHASMVRRKSCFYHLPSSMPIKYAFQHQVGSWFLHIEAKTSKHSYSPHLSNFAATEVGDCKCHGNNPTGSLVRNTGEGAAAFRAEWNLGSMKKNQTKIPSTTISCAGVKDGCPLNSNGVSQHASSPGSGRAMQDLPKEQPRTKANNSYFSSVQIEALPPFMVRTPPKQTLYTSLADRSSGVGKRIIIASNNIRVSDKQRPITPLSNFQDRKLFCYRNFSGANFLVFEISDSEEEDANAL